MTATHIRFTLEGLGSRDTQSCWIAPFLAPALCRRLVRPNAQESGVQPHVGQPLQPRAGVWRSVLIETLERYL